MQSLSSPKTEQLISLKFCTARSTSTESENSKADSIADFKAVLSLTLVIPMLEPRFTGFTISGKPIEFSTFVNMLLVYSA